MPSLSREQAAELIEPFYNLFRWNRRDWEAGFAVLSDSWRSYYTNVDYRTREETRPYIAGLFELVPDIDVEILDLQVADDTIVVRTELSGTPARDFMVPHSGRRFHIMTIDLHRVENGKIVELHHLEDWGTAIKQLTGAEK